MSSHRFEVARVAESNPKNSPAHPSELIPLVHIENEIPPPPPLPASICSKNGKDSNRSPSKLFSTILQRKFLDTRRRATIAAAMTSMGNKIKQSSSANMIHQIDSTSTIPNSINQAKFVIGNEGEESDAYSTIQSNNYDSSSSRANKFLQELRSKRRELLEKAKNISIDQRIALRRREILRVQDIFDVHFELNDDENNFSLPESNLFTEESQEKIRNDIYNELNRQREKQCHKYHQHLLLGRLLLVFMTSLLVLMSLTLIYVVIDLYDRANYLDAKLPESEFISMIHDKKTNLY
jgi:hypothetical protein